ncbi:Ig-like domain-containing protein [Cloacibacillus porcorum]
MTAEKEMRTAADRGLPYLRDSAKYRRLLFAVIVLLASVLFTIAGPPPARAELKQDEDGFYIIAASADLLEFRDGVNSGDLVSAKARLTADIDLSNTDGTAAEWKPIGYDINHSYAGTFDGAGHTVKGYRITKRTTFIGFFGGVDSGGTVRGLTVSGDINITDTGSTTYAGGVAGSCYGTIEGCVNAGSLTVSADIVQAGGIVGHNNDMGKILNCLNNGKISNSDNGDIGGIAGGSNGTISNCINGATVTGGENTGGVVGNNSGTISNCISSGTTVTGGGDTGGVAGSNYDNTISNCGWLKTDEINKDINGVGGGSSEGTFILDNKDKVAKSVVALSADITKHALNNGQTADISLSTLFGEPNKFGDYVTSIDVKISDPDILSADVDQTSGKVLLTAKAKGGTKRATAAATLTVYLRPTDFSNTTTKTPTQLKLTFGVTVTNTTKVSGVAITSHDISIYKGESARLTATVKPPEAANLNLSWSSDNPDVVSVDKDSGEIRGINVGSADITVTTEDGGLTDECTVKVKRVNVASVDISPKTLSIDMNKDMPPFKLMATVFPDNAEYGQVYWTSSNGKVAVVSPDKNDAKELTAYVTPVGRGEAKITASVGDLTSVPCVVTVTPVWAESVTVSPDLLTLEAGRSAKLSAAVAPEKATDKSVSWKSGDENIASVSESGEVFAHNPGGPILITAIAGGARDDKDVSASCSLTVTAPPVPVESVKISPEGAAIKVGESFQFTAKILPENADNKGVTWKSGDEKIATIDANGKVTAIAAGTATITVTTDDGLKTAKATVSVNRVYTSGSGCAAGVGALALFALIPLLLKKRRPTK